LPDEEDFLHLKLRPGYDATAMKNTTSILNLIYLGTKIGLFVYFFQDLLKLIS